MSEEHCRHLDDYFCRALEGDQRAEFAAHLAICPACRQRVAEFEQCNQLLQRAVMESQAVPADLGERIRHRIRQSARRRMRTAAALASAAALLVAVVPFTISRHQPTGIRTAPVVAEPSPVPPQADQHPRVQVVFPPSADVIAVPMETSRPNVTIIWVYPAIKTAETPPSKAEERNGT